MVMNNLTAVLFHQYDKSSEIKHFRAFNKAQTGFEPVGTGVADHCLTTWLLRHITLSIYSDNVFIITKKLLLSMNLTVS